MLVVTRLARALLARWEVGGTVGGRRGESGTDRISQFHRCSSLSGWQDGVHRDVHRSRNNWEAAGGGYGGGRYICRYKQLSDLATADLRMLTAAWTEISKWLK